MFNQYFGDELSILRELGAEFSKAHPALAPMLSGPTSDPDVERLLEGVAFLTALLRQRLDDEFPEIVHELVQLIFPHYLRPIPSATIIAFKPKPTLKQSMHIPAGIQIASVPVDGTPCLFKTCYDVDVHPLTIRDAFFEHPSGHPPCIKIVLELEGIKLSDWKPESLRIFLGGEYSEAANLYYFLQNHLKSINIKSSDIEAECVLSSTYLKPAAFSLQEGLVSYPAQSFHVYRIIQEYFVLPEKFLFLDIEGWQNWTERGAGNRFEIRFEFEKDLPTRFRITGKHFILSAAPAINLFEHDADPIRLDHQKTEYLIRPAGTNPFHYQIHSIRSVNGLIQGTAQHRIYQPFEAFHIDTQTDPVSTYHVRFRQSPLRPEANLFLSVAYPPNEPLPISETLSIRLECSNGALAEKIRTGDIRVPTGSTPDFVEFSNLRPPTPNILPPLGKNLLWRLISHLYLNTATLGNAKNLKDILGLYIFEENRNRTMMLANQKRIAGIQEVKTIGIDRLVSGILMRGTEITVKVRQDHYAGEGDLYLFGCILDNFLGAFAAINTFTELVIEETQHGVKYRWPARTGDRPLI